MAELTQGDDTPMTKEERERWHAFVDGAQKHRILTEGLASDMRHLVATVGRIESLSSDAAKRIEEHSGAIADLRTDIRVIQSNATQAKTGAGAIAGTVGAAIGGAMAAAVHFWSGPSK